MEGHVTSGKVPNKDVSFWESMKLCTASVYSIADMIETSVFVPSGSCEP